MAERTSAKVATRATRPKAAPKTRPLKPPKPMTATQRKTLATEQFLKTLIGSDRETATTTAAMAAALEMVNEWLAYDSSFQQNLRHKYDELIALSAPKQKVEAVPMPKPIRVPGTAYSYNPLAKADPWHVALDYGNDQLPAVLANTSQDTLREMVSVVQSRYPGTKPTNGNSNASLIDFILEHVVGPGQ